MTARFPQAYRRALALVLVLAALASAYVVIVLPVFEVHRRLDASIARAGAELERYRATGRDRASYARALDEHRRADRARAHYLSGRNAALAAAHLQGLVKRAVEEGRGEMLSMQVLPSPGGEASREVAVRARVRGDVPALQRMLHALEGGAPILVVDNLSIDAALSGARQRVGARPGAPPIMMTFEVTGLTRERVP